MSFAFEYTIVPHWSALAWLAECAKDKPSIRVFHGEWLETKEQWFFEGVWAGTFAEGNFDCTDVVAGSGARIQQDNVIFVSSGSNLDRLHVLKRQDKTLISNSLCCLLAWVDGSADPSYLEYQAHFASYRYSIFGDYSRIFPSSVGPIEITYFANLMWNGSRLTETQKPFTARGFRTFDEYRAFLRRSMILLTQNARSRDRSRPFKLLCPISNGYDSPATAVLASEVADLETFTFERDREGADDSGASIAASLGLPCRIVDRDAWRQSDLPEIPFIAGSASVGDMAFKSAEPLLRGTVLLTSPAGSPWKQNTNERYPDSRDIEVGDGALLGLSEYRLWAGFISCDVLCWGIRHIRDIVDISNSQEMKPWNVGGSYNKPIPRRILEEAGIARGRFATKKRGVSNVPRDRSKYLIASSRDDFLDWLTDRRRRVGASFPSPHLARLLDGIVALVSKGLFRLSLFPLRHVKIARAILYRLRRFLTRPYYHHRYIVHWAVDRWKQRFYASEKIPSRRVHKDELVSDLTGPDTRPVSGSALDEDLPSV